MTFILCQSVVQINLTNEGNDSFQVNIEFILNQQEDWADSDYV